MIAKKAVRICLCLFLVLRAGMATGQISWAEALDRGSATLQVYTIQEPPFVDFVRPDSVRGLEAELIQGFVNYARAVHKVEIRLEFVRHPGFRELFPALAGAQENTLALGSISIVADRRSRFDFSYPYLEDIELLISSPDIPVLNAGDTLMARSVLKEAIALTGPNSTTQQNFNRMRGLIPELTLDTHYLSMAQTVEGLRKVPRSLAYLPLPLYLYLLPTHSYLRRQRVFPAIREGLAAMFPKGSSWKAPIDDYILQLRVTGRVNDLLVRHLGPQAVEAYTAVVADLNNPESHEMILSYREQSIFQTQISLVQMQAQRQQFWLAIGGLALLAFGGGLVLVVRQSRYRKRVGEQLRLQNDAIEHQRNALAQANEELRAMQDENVRSEKLAVLGTLVSSVAHHLNSPIGAIRSSTLLLERQLVNTLRQLTETTAELPLPIRNEFFDLLLRYRPKRQELAELPSRERRKVREALLASLPPRLQPEAERVVDSLLKIGIRHHPDIPPTLQNGYRPAWSAFALLADIDVAMTNIRLATERSARFVQLLRLYVQPSPSPTAAAVAVAPVLEKALAEYTGILSSGISLQCIRDPAATCHLEPEWLLAVLQQPLHNAIQALRGGGTVCVELVALPAGTRITFSDTGPGLPQRVREHLFEPFVTTRAPGEGLGLGLYLVHRTLQAIGGNMEIHSDSGGTQVVLYIP